MNIILCITPLQVLIAEQIIKQTQGDFIGLYLPYGDNAKHRNYFKKLKNFCQKTEYIELKNQTWQARFATLNKIKTCLKNLNVYQKNINNIYLASIDVIFLQYIISKINFNQLYTFDDGTANIFPNSTYFNPLQKSFAQQTFKKLIGIKYPDIPSILAVSQKHYTIFPNEKNIIENIEPIFLFKNLKKTNNKTLSIKRILLGQALDNFIGENAYREIVVNMKQKFAIDSFVPHPRENLDFSDILTVIHSEKIIEDYLIDELTANLTTQYEIYTFMSTAVFSLRQLPNVAIFMVYNQQLMEQFSNAYQFLASRDFTLLNLDKSEQKS
nr:glycosyltransferase family 52 [uncultured Moraxella sp.]